MDIHGYGAACTDCLMFLANGETPPEMTEEETEEYLDRVSSSAGEGMYWNVGGEHAEDCPNMARGACIVGANDDPNDHDYHDHEEGTWIGDTDCYCDDLGFSWSACDVCGTRLGGDRHAVHYFGVDSTTTTTTTTDNN